MADRRARSSSADRGPRAERTARDFALIRLGRRAHGVTELTRKMERAGYDGAAIRETIDFLLERRYLDDAAFARDYARRAAVHKKWGPLRVERALAELGLAERHIEAALALAFAEGESGLAAEVLARFRRARSPSAHPQRDRARAYRHLLSRGFSPEVVDRVVSEVLFEDTDSLDLDETS